MGMISKNDLDKLKNVVLLFLAQREMQRPVERLLSTIKDIRHVMFGIVRNDLLPISRMHDMEFSNEINVFLEELRAEILDGASDLEYAEYVIDQIAFSFEASLKIKKLPMKSLRFKNIVEDLPILKPFDLNLRAQIRLID